MTKFTFIDTESLWDPDLHKAYLAIDPDEALKKGRDGKIRRRLPCKRVIAAAAFDLEIVQIPLGCHQVFSKINMRIVGDGFWSVTLVTGN